MDYVFYFDETYQDRKITIKNSTFNSMSANSFDSYIGLFWGCPQKKIHENISFITNFEQKYKSVFGLTEEQELKSDIVKKKNYQYGLSSFNKNAFDFYSELFFLLNEINPIIQIDAISKIEIFLTKLFDNINNKVFDKKNFIYSLTKLILTYNDKELISSIKNIHNAKTAENFRLQLLSFVTEKLTEIEGVERKEIEETMLNEFTIILNNITFDKMEYEDLKYPYDTNFAGLNNLLKELNIQINRTKIVIDEELNTFNSSKKYNYKCVKQANSKNSIQIRLCDWLCGFTGRFAYALFNDIGTKERNGESIEKKRLLSKDWFKIDKETFTFYQRINKFFNVDRSHYWTIMSLQYADPIVMFCTLLRYFDSYNSYEEYLSKSLTDHQELYNMECIIELYKKF